jgi:hypothetical protein
MLASLSNPTAIQYSTPFVSACETAAESAHSWVAELVDICTGDATRMSGKPLETVYAETGIAPGGLSSDKTEAENFVIVSPVDAV